MLPTPDYLERYSVQRSSSNNNISCVLYNRHRRANSTLIFTPTYEGIPENLLLNFLGWLVSMLSYTLDEHFHKIDYTIIFFFNCEFCLHVQNLNFGTRYVVWIFRCTRAVWIFLSRRNPRSWYNLRQHKFNTLYC